MGLPRPAVPEEEFYKTDHNPGETVNLTGAYPEALGEMRELNIDHQVKMKVLADQNSQEAAHVDEKVMRQLEALGYVE